jgi:hypothetical protein
MVARRRSSKKAVRKSQKNRKASRKSRRSTRRSQKQQQKQRQYRQRGGMAAYSTGDAYLLDGPTRIQAEQGPLDRAFAELPSIVPRQMGGSRRSRSQRRSQRRSRSQRSQRGGAAPFSDPYMIFQNPQGVNPQFSTEHQVRPDTYFENEGAQRTA